MTMQQAEAFVARVQEDPEFAERLSALRGDPAAAQALVVAEGFDATPEEIRAAFVEALGAELSEEQLAAIAGGASGDDALFYGLLGANMAVLTVGAAAAF